jgi:fructose-bisphosphate aldolase class I
VARKVLAQGMVPIIEPEVSIKSPERAEADRILVAEILKNLDSVPASEKVMLKLTIPAEAGLFDPLVRHPKVLRVVALSGGFSREEACKQLAQQPGHDRQLQPRASVRPAHDQSDEEFDRSLGTAIDEIHCASVAEVNA